ncbi:TetR/AcrR family transcriptional regulator [Sphingomonas sp.]|jgi:AcrR family transcriptional regulator|uniref:TetR/AcrR family transcriptional regulator n=1 Tax=unclassified Sphingomonas TaxID=196159 RepID=UPI000E101055|nr:TetR/AcrR family transcriptional regulator [Sphingomonas sp. FARSPH]
MTDKTACCPLFHNRAEHRRRLVTDTARKLFMNHGFHATGMAQLAKESGIAVGQIYRDFASKEDIVAAICNADCRTFMLGDQLHDAMEAGDSEGVRAWLRHFVDADDPGGEDRLFAEIVAEATRNERIATIFHALREEMEGKLRAALTMLAPGDALAARRRLLADMIVTLSLGLSYFQLLHKPDGMEALTAKMREVIDREIDALHAAAQAG